MANLLVRKSTGELLLDTSKITYGLVKSGYMTQLRKDGVYIIKGSNVDPNLKSSYNYYPNRHPVYGFTVENAQSPIVFIHGRGCLVSTSRTGNTITFFYASANEGTRFYCFDLMTNAISGSPYLKTFREDGVCTFNSLQPPLNVVAAVRAPGPGDTWPGGNYKTTYAGGVFDRLGYFSQTSGANLACTVALPLGAGSYAAFLPWSRSATIADSNAWGTGGTYGYGVVEGAFGRDGGISFMFGATTEGTFGQYSGPGYIPAAYSRLPTDQLPQALVISTGNLPFPYR